MTTLEFINNYVLMFYIKRPLVFFHESPVLELVITCQALHKISRPEAEIIHRRVSQTSIHQRVS